MVLFQIDVRRPGALGSLKDEADFVQFGSHIAVPICWESTTCPIAKLGKPMLSIGKTFRCFQLNNHLFHPRLIVVLEHVHSNIIRRIFSVVHELILIVEIIRQVEK